MHYGIHPFYTKLYFDKQLSFSKSRAIMAELVRKSYIVFVEVPAVCFFLKICR